jgi:hypothetical protein
MSDALIDSLIISGDEDNVVTRITEPLATGLDEIRSCQCLLLIQRANKHDLRS